ncbi:MAG: Gfo/Idh/MocA family protein, partial [Gammaproteobacteria bacterium]
MIDSAIDVAIVGLGWWGRRIVSSLHESDKLRVSLAVDARADALDELPEEQRPRLVSELDDALTDDKIDAVILATPHSLHEEQILRCAFAEKHVFSEKPLTLTAAGAERVVAACDDSNVVLGVGHMRRYEPALVEIKRLIDAGELGTLMHVESNFSHDLLADVDPADWRASADESPIPALSAMAIHLTDAYLHLFGPIEEVYALSTSRAGRWGSGDVLTIQCRFASGMTGSLSTILVTPMYVRFQVFGADAWVEALSDVHPGAEGVTRLAVSRSGAERVSSELH